MPKRWELYAYDVPLHAGGPDVMINVVTDWDREANGWKATTGELVLQGRPHESQALVAMTALTKRLGVIAVEDPELRRELAFDLELATATLLDLRDTKGDPSSPLAHSPMRPMLARLCRGVLRAHGKPDPTEGRPL